MVNESYDPSDTEEDVLDVLRDEWRANPYLIREETGHNKGAINTALTRLTSAGWVRKVTRGLYEFVDDPRTESEERAHGEREPPNASPALDSGGVVDGDKRGGVDRGDAGDVLRQEMEGTLERLDVPGRPPEVEETRRDAIRWAWSHLREQGEMKPRDLANATFDQFRDEASLNYSPTESRYDGYQLWDNCLREALRELPAVQQTGRKWVFVGPQEGDDGTDVYDPTEEF